MPCLMPSDKSQSWPFQHCPFISTSVLSVFVKRDRSACAVESGDDKEEANAGKPSGIRAVEGAASVEVEME